MSQLFERPLVFLDFETTGTDVKNDRIVEYCFSKYRSETECETLKGLLNPEMPISPAATAVHGIRDEDVVFAYTFETKASQILSFIEGCDIATYNGSQFDVPLLYNEFARVKVEWDYSDTAFVDVCNIFKINESRTLQYAYRFYTGEELDGAHDAEVDVQATARVFFAQLERYELPREMKDLDIYANYGRVRADLTGCFSINDQGEYVINFGKYKGNRAKDHLSYLSWMLSENFPADAKNICHRILNPQRIF